MRRFFWFSRMAGPFPVVLVAAVLAGALLVAPGASAQPAEDNPAGVPGGAQAGPDGRLRGIGGGSNVLFAEHCAVCHGERLEGAAQGKPLLDDLVYGETAEALIESISNGFPEKGMPAWKETLTADQIKGVALYVSEIRRGYEYGDFRIFGELEIPEEPIATEHYRLRLETVAEGLDPLPFSIAPLPNGSILVTEKMRGLRVVAPDGEVSELIEGTPTVYDDAQTGGGQLQYGQGWLLDVAPHPDYAKNGWIYLHFTDRCADCNEAAKRTDRPVSMNALIRGRIRDGRWVDEETVWKADLGFYSPMTDVAAGGRITFDPEGYVFISVGAKGMGIARGVQDLRTPYGKTHRVHDDGRVPNDNPFIDDPEAGNTIWTYGHRSPQGLEFDPKTRTLWGTEHGPRGGDEINLLKPGRNYGWPLYSKGQNYDGTPVNWGEELGIEYELDDIEQPVVDLTPSPAVSSFVFYRGAAFPAWEDDLIVGSLKAADLYRFEIEDGELKHRELLVPKLARIRDVEIGDGGVLYLLLEHDSGGRIVRVVPDGD
jgi:glucose/arabinose dehydrogenase/mono/diheme cytochrome c family protein